MGPMFIQPPKMKDVQEFGDCGIVLSFAMATAPGQQTYTHGHEAVRSRRSALEIDG
jgi:hypothetical protein